VRAGSVALNYRDTMVVENGRGLELTFPFTPGSDLAGTVEAVGDAVTRFDVGDRVLSTITPEWIDGPRPGNARQPWYRTLGGYHPGVLADYVALPQDWMVKAPTTLGLGESSTLVTAGLTAWFSLIERGRLQPGETVLVEGTGGVGAFGVQIAKTVGAEVILSGSRGKLDAARDIGADHVVDREHPDWVGEVWRLTADRGVDHILELIGGAHLATATKVAAVGARIYQIGAVGGWTIEAPVEPLLFKDLTIHGIGTGHRRALEDLVEFVDRTHLDPVIDQTYRLEELSAAFDHVARGPIGKIVIEPS
jgi:NADPH:quinone reductase-like Zn-dependent oxidoreductase